MDDEDTRTGFDEDEDEDEIKKESEDSSRPKKLKKLKKTSKNSDKKKKKIDRDEESTDDEGVYIEKTGPEEEGRPLVKQLNEQNGMYHEIEGMEGNDFGDDGIQNENSDDEGENLFGDDFEKDYVFNPDEDRYDPDLIDDEAIDELSFAKRKEIERLFEEKQGKSAVKKESSTKSKKDDDDDDDEDMDMPLANSDTDDDGGTAPEQKKRKINAMDFLNNDLDLSNASQSDIDMSVVKTEVKREEIFLQKDLESFQSYISEEVNRTKFKKDFKDFITRNPQRYAAICSMISENRNSFLAAYDDLMKEQPKIALLLVQYPQPMLNLLDEALKEQVQTIFFNFDFQKSQIHVRIKELPKITKIRKISEKHRDKLICVRGIITRRTTVFPQLKEVSFDCGRCKARIGPFAIQVGDKIFFPKKCPQCDANGPFNINKNNTLFRNFQKCVIQETNDSVPPGRIPRSKEMILLNDLVDCCRPGEVVTVTAIYVNHFSFFNNGKYGFPIFSSCLVANSIIKKEETSKFEITDEDRKKISDLSNCPDIRQRIINSIAPSIYGHEDIKLAIALALFGGVSKDINKKHKVRGDINVLLVGDPGTAKSQFLKYVETVANRSVFTTGKGSTGVGLTASVRRDAVTKEWTLEGGALVLADTGICLIDEFDKMNDIDRTSIHEAMEQQSISISKAGIVTTLQARTSIIAAANPVGGSYDVNKNFHQNVELSDPIITRFDIINVVRDQVKKEEDERLANFVVKSHFQSHSKNKSKDAKMKNKKKADQGSDNAMDVEEEEDDQVNPLDLNSGPLIPQPLLKKYLTVAKTYSPQITDSDNAKLTAFYVELRQETQRIPGGIPVSVRHMESCVRMSEASAKMHLRQHVNQEDVDCAIRVLFNSFIQSQKMSVGAELRRKLGKFLGSEKYLGTEK